MKQINIRKTGGHLFSYSGENPVPRCLTCGCDEDDAFVGGEKCSFVAPKKKSVKSKKIPTVIIEVSGGVATCSKSPKGVKVIIRDYDNEPVSDDVYYLNQNFVLRK